MAETPIELTPEQRERVDQALNAEERASVLAIIAIMDSPMELHALMLKYNWDDGFAVPMAVLAHQQCERGTALLIYHDAQGPWSKPEGDSEEHGAVLKRAKELLLLGQLPERQVAYDPGLNQVQRYRFRKAGIPEELLRPALPK